MLACTHYESPVGRLKLAASEAGIAGVFWATGDPQRVALGAMHSAPEHPLLQALGLQLDEYFGGVRQKFTLPLDLRGTAFQQQVWRALCTIPYGQTRSYSQLASALGQPNATRAVGAANGRNPVAILAPCHRVVGASGRLTGFAGGLAAKAFLLELEGRTGRLF